MSEKRSVTKDSKHGDKGEGSTSTTAAPLRHDASHSLFGQTNWNNVWLPPVARTIHRAVDVRAVRMAKGFNIHSMRMRCRDTDRVLWALEGWSNDMFDTVHTAVLAKDILPCNAIAYELSMTSSEAMNALRLALRVYYRGQCIQEHVLPCGAVAPHSSHTWQHVVDGTLPVDNHVTFDFGFHDGDITIASARFRVEYE
ncbi:Aste57867_22048 [Aphanomyces stellatus]|uniref:Aste57867_22048 protein n=1 Tax=Aphanomyces stellatus TaxID=120398 RepID=A0A485LKI3_9STRA|nr:hypothetical protein As57867_021979 [Aphanomyces stellatus]VFT98716.1 Aste57867_22048 [Aphanomyces stellatus]